MLQAKTFTIMQAREYGSLKELVWQCTFFVGLGTNHKGGSLFENDNFCRGIVPPHIPLFIYKSEHRVFHSEIPSSSPPKKQEILLSLLLTAILWLCRK